MIFHRQSVALGGQGKAIRPQFEVGGRLSGLSRQIGSLTGKWHSFQRGHGWFPLPAKRREVVTPSLTLADKTKLLSFNCFPGVGFQGGMRIAVEKLEITACNSSNAM